MRRDPPGLGLKKPEGNSVRLMYENVRSYVRIHMVVRLVAERSREFAMIPLTY
jgi:hypothetical protein